MKYAKDPLSIDDQISKLKQRGLNFNDQNAASAYLMNISYYRLRAYTYPFQDNSDAENDHRFLRKDIFFEDIINLYCFDRRLRSLIFNAIEKIEVAFRTRLIYKFAMDTNNSHWFVDDNLFCSDDKYNSVLDDIESEIERSNEDFITHYKNKYDTPSLPPSWMSLEVLSLGTLSRLYDALDRNNAVSKDVAKSLGLPNPMILANWMHGISVLRNCCAHHSRAWNRRFPVSIKLSYNTSNPFIGRDTINEMYNNKLFAYLSCIKYLLNIISPQSNFKANLMTIISDGGSLLNLKDMGFIPNWHNLEVWRS